ncbi:MAG: hypothetical protein ACOYMW_13500, partial [Candidatus Competibacteraceae bacterium]
GGSLLSEGKFHNSNRMAIRTWGGQAQLASLYRSALYMTKSRGGLYRAEATGVVIQFGIR